MLRFLIILFLFSGCQKKEPSWKGWMADTGKIKTLSTTAMIADLVKEIGGDRIDSLTLIVGELDPHSYELVKGDDEKMQRADLIFYNGLGLEHGYALASAIAHSSKATAVGSKVQEIAPDRLLYIGGSVDPHIWMDLDLFTLTTYPIIDALSSQDPQGASYYQQNGKKLREKMEKLHREIRSKLQQIPSYKRYLITSHDAFQYFTRAYLAEEGEKGWMQRCCAPEGLAPEGQLSLSDIQRVLQYMKENGVGIIFSESNVSKDSLKKIVATAKGVKMAKKPLYGDACPEEGYFQMMEENANNLVEEL